MTCYAVHATATEDIGGTVQSAGSGTHCAYWDRPYYNVLISTNVDGTLTTLRNDRWQEGNTVQYHPITPTFCYRFTGWSGIVNSSQETATFVMPGQDTGLCANFAYIGGGGGGPGDDGSGTYNEDMPCFPGIDVNCFGSPIIINFENGNYRLTGRDAPVLFDMAGNNGQPAPHGLDRGWSRRGISLARSQP